MAEFKIELFSNVYGYDDVKKELNLIRSWLCDDEILNNPKLMIPKGILFYGNPGNGKTLILREFANSFKCPQFIIEGKSSNTSEEIIKTFEKARKEKFAVVLIDEIDLLIAQNAHIERTLQQELDGINTKGQLLVLATTNNIHDINSALRRPGRFDRLIEIDYPDKKSRKEIFTNFLKDLDIFNDEIDLDHVAKVCSRCNGASIRSIINDAFLRCKKDITTEELERSYERIVHRDYADSSTNFKDMCVAIHEAGHILMTMKFNDNFTFYSAKFNSTGGGTEIQDIDEKRDTVEKRRQSIMIGLGGYLAEELIFGMHQVGSYQDYINAHHAATKLVERVCVYGIKHLIPPYDDNSDRYETPEKRRENEKLVYKILKKSVKQVRKYLKKHKSQLQQIADLMYNNGKVTYKEVANITL